MFATYGLRSFDFFRVLFILEELTEFVRYGWKFVHLNLLVCLVDRFGVTSLVLRIQVINCAHFRYSRLTAYSRVDGLVGQLVAELYLSATFCRLLKVADQA